MLYATIGDNIKMCRKERGMSQEQLALLCGYSVSTISAYERNLVKTDRDKLEKIAEILQVPMSVIRRQYVLPFPHVSAWDVVRAVATKLGSEASFSQIETICFLAQYNHLYTYGCPIFPEEFVACEDGPKCDALTARLKLLPYRTDYDNREIITFAHRHIETIDQCIKVYQTLGAELTMEYITESWPWQMARDRTRDEQHPAIIKMMDMCMHGMQLFDCDAEDDEEDSDD